VVAEDLRARRRRLHRARQAAALAAAALAAAVPAVVAVPAAAGPMVASRSSASPAGTATETETWPSASGVANGQAVAQPGGGRPDNTANKIEALAE
jgi:hypothetical protein